MSITPVQCTIQHNTSNGIKLHWNFSITDTLGHHPNEDTLCRPNHIELCTNLPLNQRHPSIQDSVQQIKVLGHTTELSLQHHISEGTHTLTNTCNYDE